SNRRPLRPSRPPPESTPRNSGSRARCGSSAKWASFRAAGECRLPSPRIFRRSFPCSFCAILVSFLDDELLPLGVTDRVSNGEDVFVPAARLVDQDHVTALHQRGFGKCLGEGV